MCLPGVCIFGSAESTRSEPAWKNAFAFRATVNSPLLPRLEKCSNASGGSGCRNRARVTRPSGVFGKLHARGHPPRPRPQSPTPSGTRDGGVEGGAGFGRPGSGFLGVLEGFWRGFGTPGRGFVVVLLLRKWCVSLARRVQGTERRTCFRETSHAQRTVKETPALRASYQFLRALLGFLSLL